MELTTMTMDYYTEELSTTEPPYNVPKQAYFVMSGVVIHVGLIFNTLSFIVLVSSTTLRQTSSGMYLVALSVADSLYLFGEYLRWLSSGEEPFGIDINYVHDNLYACRFTHFLRYSAKLSSAWLTVAITTERLLLVAFPLKHSRLSTKFSTRLTICVIFAVSFVLGSYPLWSLFLAIRGGDIVCLKDEIWYEIGSWVSLRVGSLLLPSVIVCVMTGFIIYFMTHAQNKRDRRLSSRSRTAVQRQDTIEVKRMAVEKQLTVMLITVAVAFLILRLPYMITYYLNEYKLDIWPDPVEHKWIHYRIHAANRIADTLATTNYAINFFLYYICGNVFRKQLTLVFTCAVCNQRKYSRQRSHMSSFPMTAATSMRSRSLKESGGPRSPTVVSEVPRRH